MMYKRQLEDGRTMEVLDCDYGLKFILHSKEGVCICESIIEIEELFDIIYKNSY